MEVMEGFVKWYFFFIGVGWYVFFLEGKRERRVGYMWVSKGKEVFFGVYVWIRVFFMFFNNI